MSYNGSGTFQINSSGQPVVTGTVISSTAFNALTADLATGLSTAITKDGQTTTTSRILFAQGISSTLVTDATSATTGSIITAGGISTQKALWVGTTTTLAGALTYGGVTLSNAVTGTGNMVLATSPTLTGTPLAPTATRATATTQIATTAFVNTAYGPFLASLITADQSVTDSTWTKVSLNSVITDPLSAWNSSNKQWVCPQAGYWQISGQVSMSGSTGANGQMAVSKNGTVGTGTPLATNTNFVTTTGQTTINCAPVTVLLAAGDTIELDAYVNAGGANVVKFKSTPLTYLSINWVGTA